MIDYLETSQPPDGTRVIFQSRKAIYLVDGGYLRHVPDPDTYGNLFCDWEGLTTEGNPRDWPLGKPISEKAYLAKSPDADEVYLVEPNIKRQIDPAAMDRYYFNRAKIRVVSQSELDELIDGPPIE